MMKTMKLSWYLLFSLIVGCGGIATVPGDAYSKAVANEGKPTWARTVEDEKWCEWFVDNRIQGGPWAVVAFDLRDWDSYWHPLSFTFGKSFVMEKGRVIIDGVEVARPDEPRAKWVRYNLSAMDSMLPRP